MDGKALRGEMARLYRENNALKRENARLGADLEYVAMMADVELPEGEEEDDVSEDQEMV